MGEKERKTEKEWKGLGEFNFYINCVFFGLAVGGRGDFKEKEGESGRENEKRSSMREGGGGVHVGLHVAVSFPGVFSGLKC